jgi:threonine dehydrogenase-like Zn-dependent dehydrogenase
VPDHTIRQVVVTAPGVVQIHRAARPTPGPGEVLVRMRAVGICGSDIHAVHGRHPFVPLPYHPGHEVVGVVEQVGEGVTDLAAGDRVVLEPNLTCGECRQCRDGRYNICRNLAVFGCQTPGGMADVFVVTRDRLHRVPADMSDELAALVEPLATPVHAVRRAGVRAGSRVAVLGRIRVRERKFMSDSSAAWVLELRDGKLLRCVSYRSHANALRAIAADGAVVAA